MIIDGERILPTPEELLPVEADLLGPVGGQALLWTGRATTGLYWAYRTILVNAAPTLGQPEVILPAIACTVLADSACLAGFRPRFADIDPTTGLLNLESAQHLLTPNTLAIVFVHLFGQTADLSPLANWCGQHNLTLIEDAVHALGAKLPNKMSIGTTGDFIIYSFNPSKSLECGGGGLLIRSDESRLALEQTLSQSPQSPPLNAETLALLELSYRDLYRSSTTLGRLHHKQPVPAIFPLLTLAYQGLFLQPLSLPSDLPQLWPELPKRLGLRYQKAQSYADQLANGPWQLLNQWQNSGVCWRYSLLIDNADQLINFSEAVRQGGFHVSNLYWPLNQLFAPQDYCPAADQFARRIVNLWVDDNVSLDWVEACAASLWRFSDLARSDDRREELV